MRANGKNGGHRNTGMGGGEGIQRHIIGYEQKSIKQVTKNILHANVSGLKAILV